MATRSKKGKSDRQKFDEQNREDVIHILEKVWCLNPEDTFYKIFHKYSKRGIHQMLHDSKEDVLKLEWKEVYGDLSHWYNHEIVEIKNLVQHVEHLKQKEDSPFEEFDFRCNTIT